MLSPLSHKSYPTNALECDSEMELKCCVPPLAPLTLVIHSKSVTQSQVLCLYDY